MDVLMSHGGGGVISEDASASKYQVLKGFTALTNDSDDEVIEGVMEVASITDFIIAAVFNRTVTFRWRVPAATLGRPYSGILIVCNPDHYPSDVNDGIFVYMGAGDSMESGSLTEAIAEVPQESESYYVSAWFYVTCSAGFAFNDNTILISENKSYVQVVTGEIIVTMQLTDDYTIPDRGVGDLYVIGAGGGGSRGSADIYNAARATGGGGGGGGFIEKRSVIAGDIINDIHIGVGGKGSSTISKLSGDSGGSTTVKLNSQTIVASGGYGASVNSNSPPSGVGGNGYTTGGYGASASSWSGTFGYSANAGNGELGLVLDNGLVVSSSGAGGGAYSLSSDRNNHYGGQIGYRGVAAKGGGIGSSWSPEVGGNGITPGSGGGGGGGYSLFYSSSNITTHSSDGGNGADGAVILILHLPLRYLQVITDTCDISVPSGYSHARILAVGGGQSGFTGTASIGYHRANATGGNGGTGGECIMKDFDNLSQNDIISLIIGAGGIGGRGNIGGDTSVNINGVPVMNARSGIGASGGIGGTSYSEQRSKRNASNGNRAEDGVFFEGAYYGSGGSGGSATTNTTDSDAYVAGTPITGNGGLAGLNADIENSGSGGSGGYSNSHYYNQYNNSANAGLGSNGKDGCVVILWMI